MKPRQEVLEAAYGNQYADLRSWMNQDTGWVETFTHPNVHGFETKDVDFVFTPRSTVYEKRWKWRPKSLRGFEYNNGWTVVNGPENLPTQDGLYTVIVGGLCGEEREYGFYPNIPEADLYRDLWLRTITHWREKHSGPLYGPDKKGGAS